MANIKNTENWAFETKQLHIGQESPDPASDARAVPIYQTTSYVFRNSDHAAARFGLADAGNIYGRLTNSTQDVLEKRLAALEGGVAALAVASGAAAISYTLQNLAHAGDHIVAAKTIYGGTYNLLEHTLPDYGITTTFVDPDEEGSFEKAVQPNTKAIFIEVLGNPNSNLIDIDKVAKIAHDNAIPLVVDSTFTPPNLIRPIEHGADIVIHSLTKFVGGHGTTLGGAIIEKAGRDCILNLVKNPTGANEVMKVIEKDPAKKTIVIVLNDNAQDGRDISWIYDTVFEKLMDDSTEEIICTGTRAWDMALRIYYGGFTGKIRPEESMEAAVHEALQAPHVYAVATYTALLPTRNMIVKEMGL